MNGTRYLSRERLERTATAWRVELWANGELYAIRFYDDLQDAQDARRYWQDGGPEYTTRMRTRQIPVRQ